MNTAVKYDTTENSSVHSNKTNVPGESIGFSERFGYGLGDFASNIVFTSISMFLIFYYTDIVGVSAGIIGTIMLFSRLFDGVTDVAMGIVTDKTKSKHGKARPWILWMALPFAITAVLLFSVPMSWESTAKIVYIIITYNLLNLIFTAINIPYGVLNSLITQDQYQRSILNIFRMSLATLCTLALSFIVLPISNFFGGGARGWQMTFVVLGLIAFVMFLVTFFTTKERVATTNLNKQKSIPIKTGLKAILKNKYWAIMVGFMVVTYTFIGVLFGVNIYYAQYVLNNADLVGMLTFALAVPQLAGMALMAPLIKRFGKRNTVIIGLLLMIVGSLVILINPNSVLIVLIGSAIRGLGAAPLAGSMFAMLADTIEYGEWKSGVRTEGLVFSAGSFGTKVGNGIGVAIIGWVLAFGGYISQPGAVQPESAITTIKFLFIFLPIFLMGLQLVFLYFYKLDKEYPQIVKELQERKL